MNSEFRIQHIRHATMILHVAGKRVLVDPMLAKKGAMPPTPLTWNRVRIPMTELPVDVSVLQNVDAVLLTHSHFDHYDEAARELLPKDIPVLCQPEDAAKLSKHGFAEVLPIGEKRDWGGMIIHRFSGNHGTGLVKKLMGKSSGYVIELGGELSDEQANTKRIMIGGDAIYDEQFEANLKRFAPDVVVLFAGEAKLVFGDPITMGSDDITRVCEQLPEAQVVVVHMEALNHCGLTREQLAVDLKQAGVQGRVSVPADGEELVWAP